MFFLLFLSWFDLRRTVHYPYISLRIIIESFLSYYRDEKMGILLTYWNKEREFIYVES